MLDLIGNFFSLVISPNDVSLKIKILVIVSLVSFLTFILLSIFCPNFDLKKRIAHYGVIIAIYIASHSMLNAYVEYVGYDEFLLSLNLILSLPLVFIRVKCKNKKADEELNEIIDDEIQKEDVYSPPQPKFVQRVLAKKTQLNAKTPPLNDLNYSHVKSILERLSYYPLSQSDKNKMEQLNTFLCDVENGDDSQLKKSKINEGLGELLKIMSRYGV